MYKYIFGYREHKTKLYLHHRTVYSEFFYNDYRVYRGRSSSNKGIHILKLCIVVSVHITSISSVQGFYCCAIIQALLSKYCNYKIPWHYKVLLLLSGNDWIVTKWKKWYNNDVNPTKSSIVSNNPTFKSSNAITLLFNDNDDNNKDSNDDIILFWRRCSCFEVIILCCFF